MIADEVNMNRESVPQILTEENIQVTLMIPQKFEIIRKLQSGESQSVVMASYKIGLSNIHYLKKQKDQLLLTMASNESVKDLHR
jgi:hypothetical protein